MQFPLLSTQRASVQCSCPGAGGACGASRPPAKWPRGQELPLLGWGSGKPLTGLQNPTEALCLPQELRATHSPTTWSDRKGTGLWQGAAVSGPASGSVPGLVEGLSASVPSGPQCGARGWGWHEARSSCRPAWHPRSAKVLTTEGHRACPHGAPRSDGVVGRWVACGLTEAGGLWAEMPAASVGL